MKHHSSITHNSFKMILVSIILLATIVRGKGAVQGTGPVEEYETASWDLTVQDVGRVWTHQE